MSRKSTDFLDYGIEEEIDPKIKFNSLLSVTVSTVMCLAAKCPLPKSNIQTTKLFLSTITDDNGQNPRNIKGFLTLLKNYQGPYDTIKEKQCEKPPGDKPLKEKKITRIGSSESMTISKSSSLSTNKEMVPMSQLPAQTDTMAKRIPKPGIKRNERDVAKKTNKTIGSKILTSKSVLSSKF